MKDLGMKIRLHAFMALAFCLIVLTAVSAFAEGYGIISGNVQDQDGHTLSGVILATDAGIGALSGPDGYFSLIHPAGLFSIFAYADGYLPGSIDTIIVQESAQSIVNPVVFSMAGLPPTGLLFGYVENAETHERLENATVRIIGTNDATYSEATGYFGIPVEAGDVTAVVETDGFFNKVFVEEIEEGFDPYSGVSVAMIPYSRLPAEMGSVACSGCLTDYDHDGDVDGSDIFLIADGQ